MRFFVFITIALLTTADSPRSNAEQPGCTERLRIIGHLAGAFSETPVAAGLARTGDVVELWSSNESGSWTIIITRPDGKSCVIASGENWQRVGTFAGRGSDS